MARHRPSRRASSRIRDAVSPPPKFLCESLEQRLMFVVLHGGDVFEFFAENNRFERVVVTGNTTVELIGSHIDTMTDAFSLNRMQGVVTRGPDAGPVNGGFPPNALGGQGGGGGGGGMVPTFSDSIFAMYVSRSDFTSSIAVADVPDLMATPRPMLPFAGAITLRVNPTGISGVNPPFTVTGEANSGGALLGARTLNPMGVQNQDNIPILQASIAGGLGETFPQPVNNILQAGLTVAAGNTMNAFMFGGAITGLVDIQGSINTFYAGWIVTGQSDGEFDIGIISRPSNFNVDGNLGSLVTPASIGTENDALRATPDYSSGFDMHVGGVLGSISTQDAILGNVNVTHSPSVPLPNAAASEVELRGPANIFDSWDQAILGNQGGPTFLNNDTFETAQFLGTVDGTNTIVDGELQTDVPIADYVDYYAVGLLAGQTITVQLLNLTQITQLNVGVFDPNGRLIATDYSNVDPFQTVGQPFQITADRPGTYRFAIAESINPDFLAVPPNTLSDPFPFTYELRILNTGNLGLGGVFANGNILDNPNVNGALLGPGNLDSFDVNNGDLGAVYSHGLIFAPNPDQQLVPGGATNPGQSELNIISYAVDNGNLRAVEGAQIGFSGGGSVTAGFAINAPPTAFVPHGSVGYLHTTAPTGLLAWNPLSASTVAQTLTPEAAAAIAVGGDYQWIDAANAFFGDLVAKGNIGTIRAGNISTDSPSYFQVNAGNDVNRHGTIDLIDSATNIGTVAAGGPAIVTGPGGDVRYVHCGPFGTAFRDAAFGGGAPEETVYQPGETADITDDSGTVVHLTPVGTPATLTTAATLAQLTVLTLPVRGSGGAAIVRVISTNGLDVSATGPGGVAEIGSIRVQGTGTAVVNNNNTNGGGGTRGGGNGTGGTAGASRRGSRARRATAFPGPGQPGGAPVPGGTGGVTTGTGTPSGRPLTTNVNGRFTPPTLPAAPTLPATATPLTVTLNGPDRLDVFEITGTPTGDGSLAAGGQVTSIANNTPGEIVNIHLNSLGTLTTNGTLGLAAPRATPTALLGQVHRPLSEDGGNAGNPWDYPFLQPTNMIRVLGNIVSISAAGGLGNIYAGVIQHATGDAIPATGTPLVPGNNVITAGINGNIGPIAGKLLAPVIAAGSIASVTMSGSAATRSGAVGGAGIYAAGVIGPVTSNGDFKGSIISSGVTGNAGGIIGLTVIGVLSQARISAFSRFDYEESRTPGTIITGNTTAVTFPTVEIAGIHARDGIIGTLVAGDHIGPISSGDAGFGIFDSLIETPAEGTLDGLSAGGYGIRVTKVQVGAATGSVVARGNGSNVPTTNFPSSVRLSETGAFFDPDTGLPLSFLNDIDVYLGAINAPHTVPGVTDTGVIENSQFLGSRDLGSVSAWSIRGRNVNAGFVVFPDPDFTDVFSLAATTINVANRVGSITTTGPVRGLDLTTGRTTKMRFGGDVAGLNMTIAGPIGNLVFNGSLLSDSFITAQGPAGRIGSLIIHGTLQGGVRATGRINKIRIDGNLIGNIKAGSLGTLSMGGGIGNGALTIDTNVNTIQTDGDFGVAGSMLTINGSLQNLKVGRNFNGTLTVGGNLRNMIVNGSVLTGSSATIGNTLTLLKVGGDVQAGAIIKAHIIRKTLVKGQTLGTIMTV